MRRLNIYINLVVTVPPSLGNVQEGRVAGVWWSLHCHLPHIFHSWHIPTLHICHPPSWQRSTNWSSLCILLFSYIKFFCWQNPKQTDIGHFYRNNVSPFCPNNLIYLSDMKSTKRITLIIFLIGSDWKATVFLITMGSCVQLVLCHNVFHHYFIES